MEPSRFTLGGASWINLANTIVMHDGKKVDVLEEPANRKEWLKELLHGEPIDGPTLDSVRHELLLLRDLCAEAISDLLQEGCLSDQTFSRLAKKSSHLALKVRLDTKDGKLDLAYEGRTMADRIS